MTFDFEFFLEVFGYMGTALVIVSMLMTSVVKLRIINICGSIISTIYAVISGAWPIVLLNVSLSLINVVQLIRMSKKPPVFCRVATTTEDRSLQYFLSLYGEDIKKYFPEYTVANDHAGEAHLAYIGSEAVGLLIGERRGDAMDIHLDYATPKYRDLSVATFLFSKLEEDGVRELCAASGVPEHQKYLIRMGFSGTGSHLTKKL